jgi:ferrochelatase
MSYIDAVLLIGFGGPTRPRDVRPFLERVVRGRNVSRERLEEVAHHYERIGGRSPYNELAFRQAVALKKCLHQQHGLRLPVYGGMRNWHPLLSRVLGCMEYAGRRRAAGVILAAHRSGASHARYRLDVARARESLGGGGPEVIYLAPWYAEPGFLEANAARIEEATGFRRGRWPTGVPLLFTAHSIPVSMAAASPYVEDLLTSCRGVAALLGVEQWRLTWQSASGDGRTPWLEPDVNDALREEAAAGAAAVVVHPIGFLHDHVEVLYDLDVEARETAAGLGLRFHRSATVGDHPAFIGLLAERVARLARLGLAAPGIEPPEPPAGAAEAA